MDITIISFNHWRMEGNI